MGGYTLSHHVVEVVRAMGRLCEGRQNACVLETAECCYIHCQKITYKGH